MSSDPSKDRKKLLLKLAVVGAVLLALGLAVLAGLPVKQWISDGLALVQSAGPVVFFTAMAFLPSFGAPLLAFVLPVMTLFGERLGFGMVLSLSLAAITFNMMLSYSLARWAIGPFLRRLIERLGYRLPEMEQNDATDMLVILRVTPGVPFCVQNYMAGLANIPVPRYLIISAIIAYVYNTAFIVFGDALLKGKGKVVMVSMGVLLALSAATHMVRRHYSAKKSSGLSATPPHG